MRDDYFEWFQRYRKGGFRIFYQGQTWVFKNMISSKVWLEPRDIESEKALVVLFGKGERSILCQVDSKDVGLPEGCMHLFWGSKLSKSSDYQTEMN